MNQREIALNIISKTISDDSYTNLLMRKKLEELEPIQRPFVTNLVNNVLKNYDLLLFQVNGLIDNKTSLKNKIIITMALYEKFYLKEKDYVITNEYVNLAKNKFDKAFINAILRKEIDFKYSENESINNSLPSWIYNLLKSQYENNELNEILNNYKRVPDVYYRLNKSKANFEMFDNIEIIDDSIFRSNKNLINSKEMNEGLFYIQDYNSSCLYKNLDLVCDDILLDVCCAPGSKLFNCLDIIKPNNAYANDLHKHRVELIKQKAEVLGYYGINYLNYDGCVLKDVLNTKFSKIILDAPCSGLGTLGRRPDLKFHIKPESLDQLQSIQEKLLDSIKNLLLDNGILLYSTCTLNKKENRKQIDKFLLNNKNFKLLDDKTIINQKGDCFYYAKLMKW